MMPRLWTLLLLLAAYGLRVVGLGQQELRGDEAFGYFFSLSSPAAIVSRTLELTEPHPAASYWLQHGWLALAGHSEFALRYVSAWWGILAIALLLALGQRLELAPATVLCGGALAALSPYLIWHAQDARMYSMSLALTTAATVAIVNWWRRPTWLYGAAYVLTALLALHTHYYAVYVLIGHGVALLLFALHAKRSRQFLRLITPLVITALLFLPWMIAAGHVFTTYVGNGDSPTLWDAAVRAHAVLLTGATTPLGYQWLPAGLLLAALIAGGVHIYYARPMAWVWLLVGWLVPLGLTWISAQTRPIFDARYLVAVAPPVYLLAGGAVLPRYRFLRLPRLLWALCIAAMLVGLVRSHLPAYTKDRGWRELAARLTELSQGVDPSTMRLIQNYPDPTLWYYYTGPVPHLVLPPQANNLDAAQQEVAQLAAAGVQRAVLVEQPSPAWDSGEVAQRALSTHYTPVGVSNVVAATGQWPLSLHARAPAAMDSVDATFTNTVALSQAAVMPTTLPPGGWLTVHLGWSTQNPQPATPLAVSVQLLDATGNLVAQQDQPLPELSPGTVAIADYGILIPSLLPPGSYSVTVVLYDPGATNTPPIPLQDGAVRVAVQSIEIIDSHLD